MDLKELLKPPLKVLQHEDGYHIINNELKEDTDFLFEVNSFGKSHVETMCIVNFVIEALNNEYERQFGELRWIDKWPDKICPKCGLSREFCSNYCPRCGTRLSPVESEEMKEV
jgi:hypothetical protein